MAQPLQEQLLEFSKYFNRDCSPSFLELILELLELFELGKHFKVFIIRSSF